MASNSEENQIASSSSEERTQIGVGDEQGVVTLEEVIEDGEALEENARAVLGPGDDKQCTYEQGYKLRQPLYSCQTCCPTAGICLACSYECHQDHDLVELYTKRKFRCDCGNSKFTQNQCKLIPEKDVLNELNSYNHNFQGLYCTCDRPYPDPEDENEDEMVQCVVCEDWFHTRHLSSDGSLMSVSSAAEVVCVGCVRKLPFLMIYADKKATAEAEGKCLLGDIDYSSLSARTLLWPANWRDELCRCDKCLPMYIDLKCEYLLDLTDTVHAYEALGEDSPTETILSASIKAFSDHLNPVQQREMAIGYNDMKEKLSSYLKRFATSGTAVRESDIHTFFDELKAQKRPRLELGESSSR